MAIDVTVGGPDANSYASVLEYRAYWDDRLYNTRQLAANDATVEEALIWSARLLDYGFTWRGAAADDVQFMKWPRIGMVTKNRFPLSSTVNPKDLKNAQSEFAGILIAGGDRTLDDPDLKIIGGEQALTGVKVGPIALTWEGKSFTTLDALDAFIRSLGPNMNAISPIIPDSVRFIVPVEWYFVPTVRRPIIFEALP